MCERKAIFLMLMNEKSLAWPFFLPSQFILSLYLFTTSDWTVNIERQKQMQKHHQLFRKERREVFLPSSRHHCSNKTSFPAHWRLKGPKKDGKRSQIENWWLRFFEKWSRDNKLSDVELPTRKGCHVFRASNKMEAAAAVVTEATEHSRRPLEGQTNHGGLPKVRELTLKLHIIHIQWHVFWRNILSNNLLLILFNCRFIERSCIWSSVASIVIIFVGNDFFFRPEKWLFQWDLRPVRADEQFRQPDIR